MLTACCCFCCQAALPCRRVTPLYLNDRPSAIDPELAGSVHLTWGLSGLHESQPSPAGRVLTVLAVPQRAAAVEEEDDGDMFADPESLVSPAAAPAATADVGPAAAAAQSTAEAAPSPSTDAAGAPASRTVQVRTAAHLHALPIMS